MTTKTIYLLNPYTDVIKVNALQDSVFRLYLNNSIFYTKQEIWDRITSVPKFNDNEDEITRMGKWIYAFQNNLTTLCENDKNTVNLFQCLNSYSDNICGGISLISENFFNHFRSGVKRIYGAGHVYVLFTDGAYDHIKKMPYYKGKYVSASLEELQADIKLFTEPLRLYPHRIATYDVTHYNENVTPGSWSLEATPSDTWDNLYMRMPSGSSFVFPVKSTNVPKRQDGGDLYLWANLIMTIPSGVVGTVEMPFNLLQITGTGSVTLNGTTYNLPADEAALKAYCQTTNHPTEVWAHTFTVNSNSGGLECEFLLNQTTVLLLKKNIVQYQVISGSISFERAVTAIPVNTTIVSVDKKTNASWTFDFNTYFLSNKSLRVPTQVAGYDERMVYFLPNEEGLFSKPKNHQNIVDNSAQAITADTAVIDECWAAKLTPGVDSFADSLELTFTVFNGESCYYTTDESTPDATKTLYEAPFTISATTTIKWITIKEGYQNSHVLTRVITKTA